MLALCAASYVAFGIETWDAFRDSMTLTREIVLEKGDTGFHKIQSVFAAVRLLGGSAGLAYAAQGIVFVTVAAFVFRLWRGNRAFALKAAALIAGSMLATPYLLDYDLMIAAPAIAFLAGHGLNKGFAPYEKSLLVFVFIAPLLSRAIAEHMLLPLGLIAVLLLFSIAIKRASESTAASAGAGAG